MINHKSVFLVIFIIVIVLSGCNNIGNGGETQQLARVGNDILTLDRAREEIPDFILKEDSLAAIKNFQQEWIRRKVLSQEAERLNLAQNREVQQKLRQAREDILSQALKNHVLRSFKEDSTVTDEEAQNYYQLHKDKFVLNERFVQFRHIETNTMEEARAARQALAQGREWPDVARQYSIDPEGKIRQSEQYWPISMALSDLDPMNSYLRRIGNSERSTIQRIGSTYHFVQLMDSRAEGEHPDLEWLMVQIKDWLILDKKQRHFSSYVKNLYLKANSNNEIDTHNVVIPNTSETTSNTDTLESN